MDTGTGPNGLTETLDENEETTFSSTLTAPFTFTGNYIEVLETSDANGDLTVAINSATGGEIDITGSRLEAVATPEPSTCAMRFAGLALLGFAFVASWPRVTPSLIRIKVPPVSLAGPFYLIGLS